MMRSTFALLCFLFHTPACVSSEATRLRAEKPSDGLVLPSSVLDASKLSWQPRSSYVAMAIPYEPVANLKSQLEQGLGQQLQGRGEAHITVITPPELKQLRSLLSLEEIHATVTQSEIQATTFSVVCLGEARVQSEGRRLSTYFIVVEAAGLRTLREQIARTFRARGGAVDSFKPDLYDPHITVGFTERDIHRDEGIRKDESSCIQSLTLGPHTT